MDSDLFCYEDIKKVTVAISSLFASFIFGNNTLIQGEKLVTEQEEGIPGGPEDAIPKPYTKSANLPLEADSQPIVCGGYECFRFNNVKIEKYKSPPKRQMFIIDVKATQLSVNSDRPLVPLDSNRVIVYCSES